MELIDLAHEKPEQFHSVLRVDLDEVSSSASSEVLSPDALAVVRCFHDNPKPPAGAPAEIPGDSDDSSCSACGQPKVREQAVACDGCERGFHLGCAGMLELQVVMVEEWICGECVSNGVKSDRWPLGLFYSSGKKRRFLDMDISPPSDGEGIGREDFPDSRNGFGFHKASAHVTHAVKLSFEGILCDKPLVARNCEEIDISSVLEKLRSSSHSAICQASEYSRDMSLQHLREFISEKHGVLEEGWRVEFLTSTGSAEQHVVYHAPDGKMFLSMPEVACHLGLISDDNSGDVRARSNIAALLPSSNSAKRRKSARHLVANDITESNGCLSLLSEDLPSGFHSMGGAGHVEDDVARPEENTDSLSPQFKDALPVQYEDVLSLGQFDANANQVWPCPPPLGKPMYSELPREIVGDVLEVLEFLWRFHDALGVEPFSMEEVERELTCPFYDNLNSIIRAHISMLKVLIIELQTKVAAIADPNFDIGESKIKRGKKKIMDLPVSRMEKKLNMLPINELTWPEVVRRYVLAVLSMDGNVDSPEIATRESGKVIRCLEGDGGVLCGSLTGVLGMEADALLMAQAMKKIFGSLKKEYDMLSVDDEGSDLPSACESGISSDSNISEWAQLLEPVRKLPTNVGSRIRNCVKNALEKGPPEWAKIKLEHSISKEVYKGNASGPTKKAVISVLSNVCGDGVRQKPDKGKQSKKYVSISDIIMKQCRIVLRQVAAAAGAEDLCNSLCRKLNISNDNNDERILGSPVMVSHPLDFRTIDLRLAVGAYDGSHEAFLEDVRELWSHVRIFYGEKPGLLQLADKLSSKFEELYEREVVGLSQKLIGYAKLGCLTAKTKKEVDEFIASSSAFPKAPWEVGVCKICGIDKDDDSVLLCDTCNEEYHTYCLIPPLARVPPGNWHCPPCVSKGNNGKEEVSQYNLSNYPIRRKYHSEVTRLRLDALAQLASLLEEKDYWEYSVKERILLLKFLCEELLNSAHIHLHLEECDDLSAELQKKLRLDSVKWRNMNKRESLAPNVAKTDKHSSFPGSEEMSAGKSLAIEPLDAASLYKDDQAFVEGSVQSDVSALPSSKDLLGLQAPMDTSLIDSKDDSLELNSVKNETSLYQYSKTEMETKLMKLSGRREFLGRDSAGRLYWVWGKLSRQLCVLVNYNMTTLQKGSEMPSAGGASSHHVHELNDVNNICFPWVLYDSLEEIKELVEFLRDDDPKERELKGSILRRLKVRFQVPENEGPGDTQDALSRKNSLNFESLGTKAADVLENKYGPWSELETIPKKQPGRNAKVVTEDKLFRCNCLEPVLPSTHHCLSCHGTFLTKKDLEGHNDDLCISGLPAFSQSKGDSSSKSGDYELPLKSIKHHIDGSECPYNFEEICSKFVTMNSTKELVQEIGLLGSNGVPVFLPHVSPYLIDPALMLDVPKRDPNVSCEELKSDELPDSTLGITMTINAGHEGIPNSYLGSSSVDKVTETLRSDKPVHRSVEEKDQKSSLGPHDLAHEVANCCVIAKSALTPLVGKAFQVLKQLKINLLDMEAALPKAALRPSKAHMDRRRAWRAFVKSAENIDEMLQALIAFEDLIKSEYLKNTWWYWSSRSAAAKISTLSALALRIFSLDVSIVYEKDSSRSSKSDQKSESESESESIPFLSEKLKVATKQKRKREE